MPEHLFPFLFGFFVPMLFFAAGYWKGFQRGKITAARRFAKLLVERAQRIGDKSNEHLLS